MSPGLPLTASPLPRSKESFTSVATKLNAGSHTTSSSKDELEAAASFWTKSIERHYSNISSTKLELFQEELLTQLKQRIAGHWYPESPLRGQGYRAVLCSERVDSILYIAERKAELNIDFRSIFPEHVILYLDPGCVSVRFYHDQRWSSDLTVYPPPKPLYPSSSSFNPSSAFRKSDCGSGINSIYSPNPEVLVRQT